MTEQEIAELERWCDRNQGARSVEGARKLIAHIRALEDELKQEREKSKRLDIEFRNAEQIVRGRRVP